MASFEHVNELSSEDNNVDEDNNRREKQDTVIGKVGIDGSKKNDKDNAEKGVANDNRESLNDCDICKDLGSLMSVQFGNTNESADFDFYDDKDKYSRIKRGADEEEDEEEEEGGEEGKEGEEGEEREEEKEGEEEGEESDEEQNNDSEDNQREDNKENYEKTEDEGPFVGHRQYYRGYEGRIFVTLPSRRNAYISKYDHIMTRWRCGDKTVLLDLEPSNPEYKLMADEMQSTIKQHSSLKFSEYDIKKVQRVVNGCIMNRYIRRCEDIATEYHYNERFLFHGTHKSDSIIANGFDERFASSGGMFGAGTYFAEHSSKSNQYAFGFKKGCTPHKERHCLICERKILICRVALGKIYEVKSARKKTAHPPPGFHSLQGVASNLNKGLKYNEYIIYRGEQAYPEYVVTYTLKP